MTSHEFFSRTTLSGNLRRRRKSQGLTQERLAEMADLHLVYISMIERAVTNVSIDSLSRLAEALGCQAYELLKPE
jgi:transcriptional regulator with XRE-family HTH domain